VFIATIRKADFTFRRLNVKRAFASVTARGVHAASTHERQPAQMFSGASQLRKLKRNSHSQKIFHMHTLVKLIGKNRACLAGGNQF
jgi:hypothetical protein